MEKIAFRDKVDDLTAVISRSVQTEPFCVIPSQTWRLGHHGHRRGVVMAGVDSIERKNGTTSSSVSNAQGERAARQHVTNSSTRVQPRVRLGLDVQRQEGTVSYLTLSGEPRHRQVGGRQSTELR